MLPSDHEEVYGHFTVMDEYNFHDNLPTRWVGFGSYKYGWGDPVEALLQEIPQFPRNVLFYQAMTQNPEFIRLALVDLVNNDHVVTIRDNGDKMVPSKWIQPNVRLELLYGDNFHSSNYQRLREGDKLLFTPNDESDYEQMKQDMDRIRRNWNPKCTFYVWEYASINLKKLMWEDELEVASGY